MAGPGRKPLGTNGALTGAERQARHRTRQAQRQPPPVLRFQRPADRRSRPRQWSDAAAALALLQDAYRRWLDEVPPSLLDTPTAAALRAVCALDLAPLLAMHPPRGFGRD